MMNKRKDLLLYISIILSLLFSSCFGPLEEDKPIVVPKDMPSLVIKGYMGDYAVYGYVANLEDGEFAFDLEESLEDNLYHSHLLRAMNYGYTGNDIKVQLVDINNNNATKDFATISLAKENDKIVSYSCQLTDNDNLFKFPAYNNTTIAYNDTGLPVVFSNSIQKMSLEWEGNRLDEIGVVNQDGITPQIEIDFDYEANGQSVENPGVFWALAPIYEIETTSSLMFLQNTKQILGEPDNLPLSITVKDGIQEIEYKYHYSWIDKNNLQVVRYVSTLNDVRNRVFMISFKERK